MLQAEKIRRTEALKERLKETENLFLLSFSGVNVPDITQLRSELKGVGAEYFVVKNRLFKRALEGSEWADLTGDLTGPTAIVFPGSDPIEPSKRIVAFQKNHPEFKFKSGYLDGRLLEASRLVELSKMESRETLIAKLLMLLQSPMRRLVVALNSPTRNLVTALAQVSEKGK